MEQQTYSRQVGTHRRWWGFRRLCGLAILIAVAQFAVVWSCAMLAYPGGNDFDGQAEGYSFWRNTFSDLGQPQAVNGQPNPMSVPFSVSMGAMFLALMLLWSGLPRAVACPRGMGLAIVLLGAACGAAGVLIALFLALDSYVGHKLAIGAASVCGLSALAIACLAMARGASRLLALFGAGLLILGLVHFWQYVAHFWLGHPWPEAAPATQKIAVLYGLGWIAAAGTKLAQRSPAG